jgi:hypothetical protein
VNEQTDKKLSEKTQCSGTKQVIIENSGTGQFLGGTSVLRGILQDKFP